MEYNDDIWNGYFSSAMLSLELTEMLWTSVVCRAVNYNNGVYQEWFISVFLSKDDQY